MELFAVAITVLSVILTYQAWWNGRWMKQAHQDTLSLLAKMEMGQEEGRKEVAEVKKDVAEGFKKMDDTLREIAHLVVAEGERTRQAR
ncbi:MAG: hypothetical protein HY707_14630 [Ignavibacteriae bacterium]|nr:hypothetical protein [Ignavibacteriota bacterium]